jgi:ribosomal protein S18 acetylase RimI-like enzyme
MYRTRQAQIADITQIVDIHSVSFAASFLTLLGKRGLAAYYRFFIAHTAGICFVAETDRQVVGFVSGWEQGATYQLPLVRACGGRFALALFAALARQPLRTGRLLWPRMPLAVRVLYALPGYLLRWTKRQPRALAPGDASATDPQPRINASLLSIATLPQYHGTEAAGLLHAAFRDECLCRRTPEIALTVAPENRRARAFYEKMGWQLMRIDPATVHYTFPLMRCENGEQTGR